MTEMPTKMNKKFDFNNYIIEKYGLSELLNTNINESFMDELLKGNEEDWKEMKELLNKMRILIPKLIIKIARLGGRTSLNFVIASAKRAYKQGVKHKKVLKELFFALVFLLIGFTSNNLIQKYNEDPVIKGTQIEQNGDSLIIHDSNEKTDTILSNENGNVKITETPKKEEKKVDEVKENSSEPIRLLKKGEVSPNFYHYSDHMVNALAEVENFSPVIYDAKNPHRKAPFTKKDMLNPKLDLTIGYGHALTAQERKTWKPNMKITKQQALKLYKKDLKQKEIEFNNALKKLPYYNKVIFSQGFVDGFGSLIFNAGVGSICGNGTRQPSKFWTLLNNVRIDKKNNCINASDMAVILKQLKQQNVTEKGHKYRRKAEANIISMGDKLRPEEYHLLAPEYRNENGKL